MIIPGVMLYCYPRKSSHGGCIITSALDTHNLELANHEFVQRPWTNRRHTLHSLVATVESHGCSFKLGIYNLTQYTYVRQFLFLMLINICMHGKQHFIHSSNHCLGYTMFDHLSCVAVVYVTHHIQFKFRFESKCISLLVN